MQNWLKYFGAALVLAMCTGSTVSAADTWIVKDGVPKAEIILPPEPQRLVELAAQELQTYVEKITGAELPIVTGTERNQTVKIYVGQSSDTEKLGVTDEGLKHGAYRIVSGPDYLVLLGHDFEFEPPVPAVFARGHSQRKKARAAWDEMTKDRTDSAWGNPHRSLHRYYNSQTDTWHQSQSGSLNAVYEFLRMQGVRWYMPGELGEVVPERRSMALPDVEVEKRPDFAVRRFFGPAYFVMSRPDLLWGRRLGLNQGYQPLGVMEHVHGMRTLTSRKEMQQSHPEYYALIGGQRYAEGNGQVCFSSEDFTQEAVKYVRALFDLLDEPTVDLWPNDGIRMCECEKCAKLSPSEAVFGFVDRVAREVYKTHPDRMVTCGAYSSYRLPPENIDEFSPNVGITIAFPRPGLDEPETWGKSFHRSYKELMSGWRSKVPSDHILGNSNHRGAVLMTRSIARDLRFRKGWSVGDWNEVGHLSRVGDTRGGRKIGAQTWRLGIHHLNMYVNARLLWDAEQDLDALLDEYYRLFYGPVADTMQKAFEFAEDNYLRGKGRARLSIEDQITLTEMMHAARKQVEDTVYGRRIDYILEEETSLAELRKKQEKAEAMDEVRAEAPLVVGHDVDSEGTPKTYSLVNLKTGEKPSIKTTFQVMWDDGTLIFDIRCNEPDMENLFVTEDVWNGDSVAILLETPYHAYYQMEINPDGKMVEADREYGMINTKWRSLAKVETERGEEYWRVKVRIPVLDKAEGVLDPLHNVVGDKPTPDAPWFLQVGRVRIREFDKNAYGFTATGRTYHDRRQFGRLVVK